MTSWLEVARCEINCITLCFRCTTPRILFVSGGALFYETASRSNHRPIAVLLVINGVLPSRPSGILAEPTANIESQKCQRLSALLLGDDVFNVGP